MPVVFDGGNTHVSCSRGVMCRRGFTLFELLTAILFPVFLCPEWVVHCTVPYVGTTNSQLWHGGRFSVVFCDGYAKTV